MLNIDNSGIPFDTDIEYKFQICNKYCRGQQTRNLMAAAKTVFKNSTDFTGHNYSGGNCPSFIVDSFALIKAVAWYPI